MRTLEQIEKARADRKAGLAVQREEQYAKDLDALDALEVEHGDGNVKQVNIKSWSPGIPTFVVVRMPSGIEFKRFQDTVKMTKDGKHGDHIKGANQLADVCVVYPKGEDYSKVRESNPGVHIVAGTVASDMSAAEAKEEGKD
jgi:hypothetical protein